MRRKFTESEIETFEWIGLVLFIGLVIACGILVKSKPEANIIAIPFIIGYAIFYLITGNFEGIFLAHNEKVEEYEELKLQAEAEEKYAKIKREAEEAEERIRAQSQIWVIE